MKLGKQFYVMIYFTRQSILRAVQYRRDFLFIILRWVFSIVFLFIFWKLIFSFTNDINGWTFAELATLSASCYFSWGIFVLFWGVYILPEKIYNGDIDKYLCRPINPFIALVLEEMDFMAFLEVGCGLIFYVYMYISTTAEFSLFRLLFSLGLLVAGTMLFVIIHAVCAIISMFFGKYNMLNRVLDNFDQVQQYPLSIFPINIRQFLTFIVPVSLYSTIPISFLYNKEKVTLVYLAYPVLFAVWILLLYLLWKKFLKRYASCGG